MPVSNAPPLTAVAAARERMRVPATAEERRIVERAQAQLDFPLLVPRYVPRGYRLAGLDMLDHCSTLVTVFIRRSSDWMRLTQRTAELPLTQELALTEQPFSRVTYRRTSYFIIAGTFMGEPSDGRWHHSRRKIAWEHDGRICELLQIVETSVPLHMALRIAASCRENTRTRFDSTL